MSQRVSLQDNGKPHIKIHILCYALIILGLIFGVAAIAFSQIARVDYKNLTKATEDYVESEEAASNLEDASDFLTEQSRLAVNLGQEKYIEAYCKEVTVTKNREKAISQLEDLMSQSDPAIMKNLNKALDRSNKLTDTEYHAMALAAKANKITLSDDAAIVANYPLTTEELSLSATQQKELAFQLLNDETYANEKDNINSDIDIAINLIKKAMREDVEKSQKRYAFSYASLWIFIILSFVDILSIGFSFIFIVLKPLKDNIEAIKADEEMSSCYSFELNYLAQEYNKLHSKNEKIQKKLKKQAEYDALTGLLNRASFGELCEYYIEHPEPIVLMIIDLDNFKGINDTYGHEMGDRALIRVAKVLKQNFRSHDYVCRFGGDEFIVFMTDIEKEQLEIVTNKLERINDTVQHKVPEGEIAFSLSIGVAFSENGYNADLFGHADQALYKTKKAGKGSYAIYEE